MKTYKLLLAAAVLLGTLSTQSCKKDSEDEDSDTTIAQNTSTADKIYTDVADIADAAASAEPVSKGTTIINNISSISTCATVTFSKDTINNTRTMIVDFGTTNCVGKDLVTRRGQIIVNYTLHYRDSGSVRTITFNNYFSNDNQVTGSKTVINKGHNSKGNLEYAIEVNGSIILADDGKTIDWKSSRTREWIEGESTKDNIGDDKYSITGSANGTKTTGEAYTLNITSPLIKDLGCSFRSFTQGTVELTVEGKKYPRTIDYGTGNCDKLALVTIGPKTYNITTR